MTKAQSLSDAPIAELQSYVAKHYHLEGVEKMTFDQDAGELMLDYPLPAGFATLVVTTDGDASLDYRQGTWITILNDLHKGRNSGLVWSWVIDISAGLMLLFSVAGVVLLLHNKKHRRMGLIAGALSLALPALLYALTVPYLTGV